jgi:uncharacterized protein (DUF362 family)
MYFSPETPVAVQKIDFDSYPLEPPFDPDELYPEFGDSTHISKEKNPVYDSIRLALFNLGLDKENFGKIIWSPFKNLVNPGNCVVLKPNFVLDTQNQEAVTTHGSVIRVIIDYVWKALENNGVIYVADAPQAEADFDAITRSLGVAATIEILHKRNINIYLEDLRILKVKKKNDVWVDELYDIKMLNKSIIVDLGNESHFHDPNFNLSKIHGGYYGRHETLKQHTNGKHKYCISKRILEADVVISIPKLKTHKKSGLTCCLKNLVGINVDKNYLPHFSVGPANNGGDEFPFLPSWRVPLVVLTRFLNDQILGRYWKKTGKIVSFFLGIFNLYHPSFEKDKFNVKVGPAYKFYYLISGKVNYQGSWQGNNTVWRMILDLNKIFLYANKVGKIEDKPQRKVFYVLDGFISGTRNGPMHPFVIKPGVVIVGDNAVKVDETVLLLSHIDPNTIPLYREALSLKCNWLHFNQSLHIILNGKHVDKEQLPKIYDLLPPDNWHFASLK